MIFKFEPDKCIRLKIRICTAHGCKVISSVSAAPAKQRKGHGVKDHGLSYTGFSAYEKQPV